MNMAASTKNSVLRINKYVRFRGRPYIHTCRSYVHTPRELDRHAITVHLPTLNFISGWVADSSDFRLLGKQSSPKLGDFLPSTPLNHCAKFDVASFILAGEIHNRTNKHKKQTNSNYISTPCLSACVDKNQLSAA